MDGLLPVFFGMEPMLSGLRGCLGSVTALRDLREHCADHLLAAPSLADFSADPSANLEQLHLCDSDHRYLTHGKCVQGPIYGRNSDFAGLFAIAVFGGC